MYSIVMAAEREAVDEREEERDGERHVERERETISYRMTRGTDDNNGYVSIMRQETMIASHQESIRDTKV